MTMKHLMKIFIIFFFILIISFNILYSFADELDEEDIDTINTINSIETSSSDLSTINLNARSCVILDRSSSKVLYGKNETNRVKMASTTKIMTATVILENCNLNQTVEVSKKSAGTGGSRLGLKTGDKITIRDLLYGLMLCSGNDSAVALAETAGGSIQGFSEMMNKKARDLGLTNTNFESPHGLDSAEHYTTAYELAVLTNYALKNPTFAQIVGTKNYTVTINGYPKKLNNTNELLGVLNGVYGVKTGFTNGANRCLVTACKRGEMDIICVVLGCDTKKFRTTDSVKLIEYAFKNFEYINLEKMLENKFAEWQNINMNNFKVIKGVSNNLSIYYSKLDTPVIPIRKDEISSIEFEFNIQQNLVAPVNIDTEIGKIVIKSSRNNILEIPVLTSNTIRKKDMFSYISHFFKNYPDLLKQSKKISIF